MELLAQEDGWKVLSSLSQQDVLLVAPAVWDALAKVHTLSLPSGGSPVLADCRSCNVMVKYVFQLLCCSTLSREHNWPVLHSFNRCFADLKPLQD